MLKTFENFEHDNSKIWIIGIPSGESLQIDRDKHKELYDKQLIIYSTQYSEIGFYLFDDKNIKEINKIIKPSSDAKDYMIYDNEFNDNLINMIKIIVEKYPYYAELYASEEYMGISYEKNYIEIKKNNTSPNYYLEKRVGGIMVDSYNIATEKLLLKRIEIEMNN